MKAFKEQIEYNFICRGCRSLMEVKSNEFDVIDIGTFGYDCPVCKKKRLIKSRNLSRKVIYVDC